MAIRATRIRRLRIRQALRGSTVAVAAMLSANLVYSAFAGATPNPQANGTVAASATELGLPDVGVWAVDGTSRGYGKVAAMLVEASASAGSVGTDSVVVEARAVVMGKVHDVLTNAGTVGELLSAMGITPGASDRVHPSLQAPLHSGMSIRYDRIRTVMRRVRTQIPFTTQTTLTSRLAPGRVRITRAGHDGMLLSVYRVRVVNGKVTRRTLLRRHVLWAAVAARRMLGRTAGSGHTQTGEASWYDAPGTGFTAASPSLPFGTEVTVTDLATGESIVVVINDRGPFGGRIIDLSSEAFAALEPLSQGVMQVRLSW